MLKKKGLYIILAAIVLVGAGAYAFITKNNSTQVQSTETSAQTATAFIGTLTISATGMGTVVAAEEASVGFYEAGTVGEILVGIGDEVKEGDVLAKQGNADSLKLAVTDAELQLELAKSAIQNVNNSYETDLADAQLAVVTALVALEDAQETNVILDYGRCDDDLVDEYYDAYNDAKREYERIKDNKVAESVKQDAEDALYTAWQNYNFCITPYTDTEIAEGDANLSVTQAALASTQAKYDKLKKGVDEDEVKQAEAAIATAEYNLSVAQKALDGTTIVAPISGTIMSIAAGVGDTVDGSFITINQTTPITLTVMLDETDLNSIAVGYEVEVVFDAFENQTFTGHVTLINPGLTSMGNTGVVTAKVVVDEDSYNKPQNIPIGISASVEVINNRASEAVLVPIEALIDLGDGQYALFVVEKGKLTLHEVGVGIMDYTDAEITSGLEAGEVVTTGIVETHS